MSSSPDARSAEAAPASSDRRSRLFGIARILLAAAVLAFVAANIAWRDELTYHRAPADPEADPLPALVVPGALVGDWKSDAVRFRPVADATLAGGWPDDAAATLAAGGELAVTRRPGGQGSVGFDWRPGVPRAFRDVEVGGLVVGTAAIWLGVALCVFRWQLLLRLAGCPSSWWQTARLTLLGYFFNLVVPGLTGGDVVKGVIVARENPRRRADALVSIVVDRVVGLIALMALTGVTLVVAGGAFRELRLPVFALIAAILVGAIVYVNPRLRSLFRVEQILDRVPLGDKLRALDRAGVLYLRHPLKLGIAGLLSLGNHVLIILGVWVFGRAFGVAQEAVSLGEFFVVVPVANIVAALPIAPGGWGLGEAVYKELFERIGASGALGVVVSVTFRLTQLGLGLLGGLYLLMPSGRREVREAEAAS